MQAEEHKSLENLSPCAMWTLERAWWPRQWLPIPICVTRAYILCRRAIAAVLLVGICRGLPRRADTMDKNWCPFSFFWTPQYGSPSCNEPEQSQVPKTLPTSSTQYKQNQKFSPLTPRVWGTWERKPQHLTEEKQLEILPQSWVVWKHGHVYHLCDVNKKMHFLGSPPYPITHIAILIKPN